jgi:hypothetical protein
MLLALTYSTNIARKRCKAYSSTRWSLETEDDLGLLVVRYVTSSCLACLIFRRPTDPSAYVIGWRSYGYDDQLL